MPRSATRTVKLSKLARQLRREALASPKKAVVLGVLALLASYYWGPLVWGWISPSEESAEPTAAEAGADLDPGPWAAIASAQAPTPTKTRQHPWTQLDEWIRQDPTTTPVEDPAGWRDPFTVVSTGIEVDQDEEAQPDEPQVTPATLGVELSGTLVGPDRRVALIGGKAYREGQTIKVDQDDRPIEFELVEVHPQRIVLHLHGSRFDLAIPERRSTGLIEPSGNRD